MARALRLLTRAAFALAALVATGCSEEGCQFEFEPDAVTRDGTPWICSAGGGPELSIAFYADGSGLLDGAAFAWTKEFCRVVALDFADPTADLELFELGGNVEVGRLTFVLNDATYLCGYGVPPP